MKIFIEDVMLDGEFKGKMFIESDSMQYMINIYNGKVNDKGVESYTNKGGYHATLQQAVKVITRMKINESTATTLSELLQDIKRIEAYIESKINF